tara:strand:+ start:178 stop:774 length:597 start_codon:yes stop_codon:yes gene_type:complete
MDKQSSPPPAPQAEAKSIDHIKTKPVGWCKSSDGVKCQTNTHYFVELQPQILTKKNVGFGNVVIKKMNLDLSRFIDSLDSTKKTNNNQETPKKVAELEGLSREIQDLDPKSVQISDMWNNSNGEKIYLLIDLNTKNLYLVHQDEIKVGTSGGRSSNRKKRGKRTKKRKSRKRKSLYKKKKSKRRRRKKRKTRKKRKKY